MLFRRIAPDEMGYIQFCQRLDANQFTSGVSVFSYHSDVTGEKCCRLIGHLFTGRCIDIEAETWMELYYQVPPSALKQG